MNHFRTGLDRGDLRIGLIKSAPENLSVKACPASFEPRAQMSRLLSTLSSFHGVLNVSSS